MLAYIYIPVIQKELDTFRTTVWNNHRGSKQKDKELPTGVPEHIFRFPEKYGGEDFGIEVTEEQLEVIAEEFSIFDGTEDFLETAFRKECERHISITTNILPKEAADAYKYLKLEFDETRC